MNDCEGSKESTFVLYQKGYEPYIDFLKGYLILCVLFTHSCVVWDSLRDYSLYYLWGCAPVAGFMLVSTLHYYRKGLHNASCSLWKHIRKVILPFLIIQLLLIVFFYVVRPGYQIDVAEIKFLIRTGGYGVGSYFPWIYIQYMALMMLLTPILNRLKNKWAILVFLLFLSISIEVLCSIFSFDDGWYRVLVFRFPFLIYLGIVIDKEGLSLTKMRVDASFIAFVFIILFIYGNVNLEPLFYNTSWKQYHWICYPYLAFFLLYLISILYKTVENRHISNLVIRIGKASYGIFLFQSVWFMYPFWQDQGPVLAILYVIFSIVVCTICGVALKEKVLDCIF